LVEREVEVMKKCSLIKNDNIVKFHELIEFEGEIYYVMEYCDESLEELMNEREIQPSEVYHCYCDILNGLKGLHSEGVIHRDLKPDNIMIKRNQSTKEILNFKIIDFTTAKCLQSSKHMTTNTGTRFYQAPEVLKSGSEYSEKADYYSFGVILHQMMSCGHLPSNQVVAMLQPDPTTRIDPSLAQHSITLNQIHEWMGTSSKD